MQGQLRRMFEERKHGINPLLAGVRGTYRFNIPSVGSWVATIDNGHFDIKESSEPGQCEIECEEEDFIQIVEGRQNLLTAALQGRVIISGDLALAQKFHGFARAGAGKQSKYSRRTS